jgi:hypothetical protein
MDKKKQRERAILDEFRKVCPDFPPGEIIDCESPDFLLPSTDGTIGFEVTEYIRGQTPRGGSPLREREKFREKVVLRAQKLFEQRCIVPLNVIVHWLSRPTPKANPEFLAASIADLVAAHVPTDTYQKMRLDAVALEGTRIEDQVLSISIWRLRPTARNGWAVMGGAFVGIPPDELQTAIDGKKAKVAPYRLKCDRVWLIIAAGLVHISSHAEIHEEDLDHVFLTPFDRVFFYDWATSRCVSLVTSNPQTP